MPVRATLAALALALGAPAPASAAGACAAYGPGDAHLFCANVVDYAVALAPGEELFKKMQPFVIIGFCWSLFSVLTLYSEFEKVVNRSAWESSFDDWGDCLLAHWALPRSGQKDACGVVPKHLEPGAASTLARRGADADRRFLGATAARRNARARSRSIRPTFGRLARARRALDARPKTSVRAGRRRARRRCGIHAGAAVVQHAVDRQLRGHAPVHRRRPRANHISNSNSTRAYSNGSTRALPPCFETSMRAIDPSKNQPNRLRCDRAREFQSLVGTSRTSG